MIAAFALLFLASGVVVAAPPEGPEALCAKVARVALPSLEKSPSFALQVAAEGGALDLADGVRAWCELALGTESRRPAPGADHVVRLRLRVAGATLLSTVDVLHARKPVASETVEAPLGATLAQWSAAGGSGLETWLAGSVDRPVLALCGGDPDRDGVADLLVFTGDQVQWLRWGAGALELAGAVPVPPKARPRARAPTAHATCFELADGLGASFAVPDRNTTGAVSLRGATLDWRGEASGVELARLPQGLLEGTGIIGTNVFRLGSRLFAAAAAAPGPTDALATGVFVTQDGVPFAALAKAAATLSDRDLEPLADPKVRLGSSVVFADLDGDGSAELVATRAVVDGPEATDRLVAIALAPFAIRHESQPIRGTLGTLGVVRASDWTRVIAAQRRGGRTDLVAYGRRHGELR